MRWLLAAAVTVSRCLCRHATAIREKRDESGRLVKPQTVEWYCTKCLAVHGETSLVPSWPLLARLRRQLPWSRTKTRMKVA